jgi:hypothetical protein
MLKISLDEAYVFDLLSINQVKINNSVDENKLKLLESYTKLSNEIISQIGGDLFKLIIDSVEYQDLVNSNQYVFDLVDRADENELSKITADANFDRYLKKITLQNKFFKNNLTEIKL